MITKDNLRVGVGKRIKYEREIRNMSIIEMADAIEVSPGFIGLMERGKRGATVYNLMRVSQLFGLSIDEIVYDEESERELEENYMQRSKLYGITFGLSKEEMAILENVAKALKSLKNQER